MKRKKIVFTAPWEVDFREDSFSESIEGPHDILVQNQYSMVSAGTELACLGGKEDWFELPGIPGYLSVGKVLEKGNGVEHLEVGDRVYTYGPHASIFRIDTSCRWSGLALRVPDGLSSDVAPFARMASIAMTAIRKSEIELGDEVAVAGLGPIGNLAAQEARLQGARVMAFDARKKRVELARECGLEEVFHSEGVDVAEALREKTGGRGVSTLIDATGSAALIESMLPGVALYGEVILLGSPRHSHQTDLTRTLQHVHLWTHGSVTLKGALEFTLPTHAHEFVKHSTERNTGIIFDLMMQDRLKVRPFYTHCVSPARAAEVYRGLQEEKDTYMGVVFDWT